MRYSEMIAREKHRDWQQARLSEHQSQPGTMTVELKVAGVVLCVLLIIWTI